MDWNVPTRNDLDYPECKYCPNPVAETLGGEKLCRGHAADKRRDGVAVREYTGPIFSSMRELADLESLDSQCPVV